MFNWVPNTLMVITATLSQFYLAAETIKKITKKLLLSSLVLIFYWESFLLTRSALQCLKKLTLKKIATVNGHFHLISFKTALFSACSNHMDTQQWTPHLTTSGSAAIDPQG